MKILLFLAFIFTGCLLFNYSDYPFIKTVICKSKSVALTKKPISTILKAIDNYYNATTTKYIDQIKTIFYNSNSSGLIVNSMMYITVNESTNTYSPVYQGMTVNGYDNIVQTFTYVFAGWRRIFVLASGKSITRPNGLLDSYRKYIGVLRYLIAEENYDESGKLFVTITNGVDQFLVRKDGLITKIANLEMSLKLDDQKSALVTSANDKEAVSMLTKWYCDTYRNTIFAQSDANSRTYLNVTC